MARAIGGKRVAKANRQTVTTTQETHQFDFGLASDIGLWIFRVEFAARHLFTPGTTYRNLTAEFALHAENPDSLENSLNSSTLATEGETNVDSEILAQAILQVDGQDEAATRGGSAAGQSWNPSPFINFISALGEPLSLAIDPTFKVRTDNTNLSLSIAQCSIWYQYVEFTSAELGRILARRR